MSEYKKVTDEEKAVVVELGGLHVVSERLENCIICVPLGQVRLIACSCMILVTCVKLPHLSLEMRLFSFTQVSTERHMILHSEFVSHTINVCPHPQVGTERHESRRVDNQLRGRSGRQGDPGSTRQVIIINIQIEAEAFRGSNLCEQLCQCSPSGILRCRITAPK